MPLNDMLETKKCTISVDFRKASSIECPTCGSGVFESEELKIKLQRVQKELPLRIAFVAFLSPKHPALSNSLAIETLHGDLAGSYGDQVNIELFQAGNEKSIGGLLSNLARFRPSLIGLSVQPGSLGVLDAFFNAVPHHPYLQHLLYLIGNQLSTYFPSQLLQRYQQSKVIIVRGEGELPLRTIVRGILAGDISLNIIPNIVYRDAAGKIVFNPVKKTNLAELIHPPSTNGLGEVAASDGFALIEASRGCSSGGCVYCTRASFRFGKGWEPFPVERVLENFSNILNAGIQRAECVDDEFFGGRNPDNLRRICKLAEGIAAMQQEKGSLLSFGIMTTPNVLYRPGDPGGNTRIEEVLRELHNAGLVKIYWGVEALSFSQLVRYGRKAWMKTKADVETQYKMVIQLLKRLNIESEVGLAMLDPFISLEELRESLDLFERLKLFDHNMWPFRPLVVNEGAPLAEKLWRSRQIREVDINFMCYRYEYQDPHVSALIQFINEVDKRLPELMPLVYHARTVSRKRFPGQPQTDEVQLANTFVRTNAFAYLNLIQKCLACLSDVSPDDLGSSRVIQILENAVAETVERLEKMQEELREAFKNGRLSLSGRQIA
jgi:hypothetical protein